MGVEISDLPEAMRKQVIKKLKAEGVELRERKKAIKKEKENAYPVLGKEECNKSDEGAEQEALFSWAHYAAAKHPCLNMMHHIPNGGMRNEKEAIKLRRQGVKRGVSDIFLPHPSGGYHGLYIELKAKGGTVSTEQDEFLSAAAREGYMAAVCFGADSARKLIEEYLEGEDPLIKHLR